MKGSRIVRAQSFGAKTSPKWLSSDRNRDSLTEAWRHWDWLLLILPPLADAPSFLPQRRSSLQCLRDCDLGLQQAAPPLCRYDSILSTGLLVAFASPSATLNELLLSSQTTVKASALRSTPDSPLDGTLKADLMWI